MARLVTTGFEFGGDPLTFEIGAKNAWGSASSGGGTSAVQSATKRTGGFALKQVLTVSSTATEVSIPVSPVAGRTYYFRSYINIESGGVVIDSIMQAATAQSPALTNGARVSLDASRRLQLTVGGTLQSGTSAVLNLGQWYRVELMIATTAGAGPSAFELRLDGTTVASGSAATFAFGTLPSWFCIRAAASARAITLYHDDVAINDDQGSAQTSWPGAGEVRLVLPASDSARTGWTDAAGGTSSLFDSINNLPPVGGPAQSPLGVRAVGTAVTTGSMTTPATLTPTIPAGGVVGDIVLCFCYFDTGATASGQSISVPAGWNDLGVDFGTQAGSQLGKVLWAPWVSGMSAPAVVFTGATTGNSGGTAIACNVIVSGADLATPLGESGAAATGASDTNTLAMGAGSFTLTAGRMLFAFGGKRDDGAANVLSGDGLTWTERLDSPSTGGADAMMVIDSAAPPGADTAITAKTATLGTAAATSATSAGRMFSIRPQSAVQQIQDANNNATDTYDANLQSYTVAGLGAGDTITLVQPFVRGSSSSTTSTRDVGIQVVSNPAIAEAVLTPQNFGAAAGSDQAGGVWDTKGAPPTYAPSATLGTGAVMRLRKGTATTDTVLVDIAGIQVESVPAVPAAARPVVAVCQAVNRSAVS